uniref:Uncharacterized protein n=1 Tax=Stegastes partitus TaxID=144197 RepID=A0A3B4Z352_9TELE
MLAQIVPEQSHRQTQRHVIPNKWFRQARSQGITRPFLSNRSLLKSSPPTERALQLRQHSFLLSEANIVSLFQTRYWASVEESLSAWENFLLGKGSHPTDSSGHSPEREREKKKQ